MWDQSRAFMPYPFTELKHAEQGPLSGLTFAVKDLFDVAGYPTGGEIRIFWRCPVSKPVPLRQSNSFWMPEPALSVRRILMKWRFR